MLVDVNVPCTENGRELVEQVVAALFQNGYKGVVLNKEFSKRPADPKEWEIEPLDLQNIAQKYASVSRYGSLAGLGDAAKFVQLRRITLELETAAQQALLQTGLLNKHFDILAVKPLSEKMFQLACTSLEVDLIQLDMSQRASFLYKHTLVNAAIQRGVSFELTYSSMLRDDSLRRHFMHHAANLIRVTHGKNVVLSSGALNAMEVRSPSDASNLLTLFGVGQSVARATVTENVRALLVKSFSRKKTFKQVIAVDVTAEPDAQEDFIRL